MSPKKIKFAIIALSTFMAALDASIVNVSIPAIMESFQKGIDDVEWVVSAYMIAFAASMPLSGWIRERKGNLFIFSSSIALFTVASFLCGSAPSLPWLILARILQAIGGGAIIPSAMAMIAEIFEPEERPHVLGWWGFVAILGPSIGPTLGGVLTEHWGWPSIFYVNIPLGVILFFASQKFLKTHSSWQPSQNLFPWRSFLSTSVFIISLLYLISLLLRVHWLHEKILISASLLCLSGCITFFDWKHQKPAIIDFHLLKNSLFLKSLSITFIRSMTLFGTVFLVPIFLQNARGFSETHSGLILLPASLVMGLCMPITGRFHSQIGAKNLILCGGFFLIAYCFSSLLWSLTSSALFLSMILLLRGFGVGLMMTPTSTLAMNSVDTQKVGAASSLINLVQHAAGALGVAIFSGIFEFLHFHQNSAEHILQAFQGTMLVAGILNGSILAISLRLPKST